MQIKRVDIGDETSMPVSAIGDKGGGVVRVKSLINGLLITLTPREINAGLLFIPEEKLNEVEYHCEAHVNKLETENEEE